MGYMANNEDAEIIKAMHKYGGSFVQSLANCFDHADINNFSILKGTFHEYWEEYKKFIKLYKKYYISFGQDHFHIHNGNVLDSDTIGVIESEDYESARMKAFEWFGKQWSMVYEEEPEMEYFPKGLINLQ